MLPGLLIAAVTGIHAGSAALALPRTPGDPHVLDDQKNDKHACKGKNDCKGRGGCKTERHACKGKNDCKGQGGCNM